MAIASCRLTLFWIASRDVLPVSNGTGLSRWFGSPSGRVKMFDQDLFDTIVGSKNLDCGPAGLGVNLVLRRGHGSLLLNL